MWLLAALGTLAVYWSTTGFRFLLDDVFLFQNSASLHNLSSIGQGFVADIGAVRQGAAMTQGGFYRPIFLALSTLYFQVVGPSPLAWHLAAVVLAAAVAALAAAFLRRLGFLPLPALLGALVFALHPSHVGSVAWVSGIQEQLAALFAFVALLALLSPGAKEHPRRALTVATLAFALALLSKEVAIALAPLVAVWAWSERRGDPAEARRWRHASALFGAVAIVYLAVRWAVFGALVKPWTEAPGFARAAPSVPLAFVTYVRMLLWPAEFSFVRPERPVWGWLDRPALLSAAALAVLGVLAYLAVRRRRELLLPVAWFVVWLLPVMSLWAMFPEWMVTDRYLYLPALALPWALLIVLPRQALTPALAAIAILFALLTLRYAAVFATPKTFSTAMLSAEPTSTWMLDERARVYMVEGNPRAAEDLFRRAIALDPLDAYALWKIGSFETTRGEFDAAKEHYRQAVVQEPRNSEPFTTLAYAMAKAGQRENALALLEETVGRWPDQYEPALLQAVLLTQAGDRARAETAFAAARRARPNDPVLSQGLERAIPTLIEELGLGVH